MISHVVDCPISRQLSNSMVMMF